MLAALSSSSSTLGSYTKLTPETVNEIKEETQKRLAGLKSWRDFFAFDRFVRPTDFASFSKRLNFNWGYFQNNYILVSIIVVAYFLLTNVWLLLATAFAIGGNIPF